MTNREISELANNIVDRLNELAEMIDSTYYEECADSACTNKEPLNDTFRVLRHLVATAGLINASGLCDLYNKPEWTTAHPFVNLAYQWYI